jgi:osmotically-inducible protein OsmY
VLDRLTRRAREVLIERGGSLYRVPAASVTFEGKTMHLGEQPDALVPYRTDEELRERVRDALASAREISSGELQQINTEADGAEIRLTGNVRSKHAGGRDGRGFGSAWHACERRCAGG